jgi:hypothetical protein
MAEAHIPHAHHGEEIHHEVSDINVGGVLLFGGGLFVVTGIVCLLVWVLFGYFNNRETIRGAREYPLAVVQENRLPPEPRLQTNPREDLRELRAREDEVLTTYGWVDKNAGVVRIPIEEAMKIVVQRGLPTRQVAKGTPNQAGTR